MKKSILLFIFAIAAAAQPVLKTATAVGSSAVSIRFAERFL